MKKTAFFFAPVLSFLLLTGMAGCKKTDATNESTLTRLYKTYKDGSIEECQYKGQMVYHAALNAYDAGSVVYNKDGKQIGACNSGTADSVCSQLTGCETIYMPATNIWGQPAVDKYGLGR